MHASYLALYNCDDVKVWGWNDSHAMILPLFGFIRSTTFPVAFLVANAPNFSKQGQILMSIVQTS